MAGQRRMNDDARKWVEEAVGSEADAAHVVSELEVAGYTTVKHLEAADRDDLAAAQLMLPDIKAILKHQKQAESAASVAAKDDVKVEVERTTVFDILNPIQPSKPLPAPTMHIIQREAGEIPTVLYARPDDSAAPTKPLPLTHPVFGSFLDSMAYGKDLSFDDLRLYDEWVKAMADFYPNEAQKRAVLMPILRDFIDDSGGGSDASSEVQSSDLGGISGLQGRSLPDFVVRRTVEPERIVLVLGEVKGEGSQIDPLWQAILTYTRYVDGLQGSAVYEHTCCPCLLVEIVGPGMRVSAVAMLHRPVVQRLTPMMHYLPVFDDNKEYQDLARGTFLAVRRSANNLDEFYGKVAALENAATDLERDKMLRSLRNDGVPLLRTARSGMTIQEFSLPFPLQDPALKVTQLSNIARKWVYRVESGNDSRVVKFSEQYGESVHRAWAAVNFAPTLLDIKTLPGAWLQVEMEYLSADDGWLELSSLPTAQRELAREAAVDVLRKAHAVQLPKEYGENVYGVHGDARDPNVLVKCSDDGSFNVKFIDFDWAGVAGSSEYPAAMNYQVDWAAGITPCGVMEQYHDMQMLSRRPNSTRAARPIGALSIPRARAAAARHRPLKVYTPVLW